MPPKFDLVHNHKLSKAEYAYEWLRVRIRDRVYEPGFRLVLSTIAAELDVSVVPVREAIRRLEAEGLVTYERNVGARVTNVNRESYFNIMETVALLEARATANSAPHLQADDLAEARAVNAEMRILLEDFVPHQFTKLNRKFHSILFSKCDNTRLTDMVAEEWDRLDSYRDSTFRWVPSRAPLSIQEHDQLVGLIELNADPGYIEQVARDHRMTTARMYRRKLLQEQQETSTKDN